MSTRAICYQPVGEVLKRSLTIPKRIWRMPSTRRMLEPLTLEPFMAQALQVSSGLQDYHIVLSNEVKREFLAKVQIVNLRADFV